MLKKKRENQQDFINVDLQYQSAISLGTKN